MNKIIAIREISDDYDGYMVATEKDTYEILIDNIQQCCENWGYFSTDDDLQQFIGKELATIEVTNTALETFDLDKFIYEKYLMEEDTDIIFVTFKLTNGEQFQLAVYNSHNGYYGHSVLIKKNKTYLEKTFL